MHQNGQKTEHMRNKLINQELLHSLMKQFLFSSLLCPNGIKSQANSRVSTLPIHQRNKNTGQTATEDHTLPELRPPAPSHTHCTSLTNISSQMDQRKITSWFWPWKKVFWLYHKIPGCFVSFYFKTRSNHVTLAGLAISEIQVLGLKLCATCLATVLP